MNFTNCPDWICHDNGIPHDYIYGVTTFLITIPFLILAIWLLRKWSINLSRKRKYFFILATPVAFYIYNATLFFTLVDSKTALLNFIGLIAVGPMMIISYLLPFWLIGAILFVINHFYKLKK